MSLFTPSGGLVYHLRALRYRSSLWAPFRRALAGWLGQHFSGGAELILVGPSAGHCLPFEQLKAFRTLLVLEPDPVARRLLRQRLAPCRVETEARDLLVAPLLGGGAGLEPVLERWPRAAVLFCNVLGQVQLGLSAAEHERFPQAFQQRVLPLLEQRVWASFHDRWSLDWQAAQPVPISHHFEQLPSDDELGQVWFGPGEAAVTAFDHDTTRLFPAALARDYLSWQITPHALHVVEAVSSAG